MKNQSLLKRGFTLVELMIVIVILGVLAAALLPRLGGAGDRARDFEKIAISRDYVAALEAYFNLNGSYPGTNGEALCMDGADVASLAIDNDVDIQAFDGSNITVDGEACDGYAVYVPLEKQGQPLAGFALIFDVQSVSNANLDLNDVSTIAASADLDDLEALQAAATASAMETLDATAADETVHMILR